MNREVLPLSITDPQSWVIGLQGQSLSAEERQWLCHSPPLGVILFARNVNTPAQTKALLDDVRQCTGQATWAAIDEEGGRIWRLPFPPFNQRYSAAIWQQRYRQQATHTLQQLGDDARYCGEQLKALGFTHNCAPVLDVRHPVTHGIIGDRAYGETANDVARLACACIQGYHEAGIAAIGKHFPGHGLARTDSHLTTPVVTEDEATVMADAEAFRLAISHGLQHVMTAHVRYPAMDAAVATFSPYWLQTVLRQRYGFSGHIWSDDLCMQGAGGQLRQAVQQAQTAGCNVLLICQPEGVAELYRR